MTLYVIKREDGAYVSRQGSEHSYTRKLQEARPFNSRAGAEHECCSNEHVVSVDSEIYSEGT